MSHPRRVLLVENDPFTRHMMRDIIETLGVEVEIACDGRESIQILRERPEEFGLILMDLHMPNLSGMEATAQIRKSLAPNGAKIPIIAVTADTAYHNDAVVRKLEMDGYASKPVTPGQLLNLIDRFCVAA